MTLMGVGILAAIVAAYMYSSHKALVEMRSAFQQMQTSVRRDQMPLVWLDPPSPDRRGRLPIVLTVNEPIEWTFGYSNYGRAPALHITGKWYVFPGAKAKADVDTFFSELPERIPGKNSPTMAMPNVIGEHSVTARSRDLATPDDFINSSHDGGLYLAGRLEYEGPDGTLCRSDFCRFNISAGGMGYCEAHNEVHCNE
jgi:hypothetical protein